MNLFIESLLPAKRNYQGESTSKNKLADGTKIANGDVIYFYENQEVSIALSIFDSNSLKTSLHITAFCKNSTFS